MTAKGAWVGICIKFALYDRTSTTTHWSPSAFDALTQGLEHYINHLGSSAFMFRAKVNPALVQDLPERHPYNTLLSEKPTLTEDEIGTPKISTGIIEASCVVRGPTLELRPVYGDGHQHNIFMHEYTAFSLFGYLEEYIAAAKVLSGPAAGTA